LWQGHKTKPEKASARALAALPSTPLQSLFASETTRSATIAFAALSAVDAQAIWSAIWHCVTGMQVQPTLKPSKTARNWDHDTNFTSL